MALIHVNESDFREQVLENSGTVLVDFWANWCGPCRMLGPVLEQLAADRPDVTVAKVDVDENMSLAAAYGVESIPMLLVFKNGQLVNKSIGFVSQAALRRVQWGQNDARAGGTTQGGNDYDAYRSAGLWRGRRRRVGAVRAAR